MRKPRRRDGWPEAAAGIFPAASTIDLGAALHRPQGHPPPAQQRLEVATARGDRRKNAPLAAGGPHLQITDSSATANSTTGTKGSRRLKPRCLGSTHQHRAGRIPPLRGSQSPHLTYVSRSLLSHHVKLGECRWKPSSCASEECSMAVGAR